MTYNELELLTEKICCIDDVLKEAKQERRLFLAENGQASPCLDLRYFFMCFYVMYCDITAMGINNPVTVSEVPIVILTC